MDNQQYGKRFSFIWNNASEFLTDSAGGGESDIRRYIVENNGLSKEILG